MHDVQEAIRAHVDDVWAIQATLELDGGTCAERQAQFQGSQAQFHTSDDPIRHHMGQVMAGFAPGLFVGGEEADLPKDNLDLERWFRLPRVTSVGSTVIAMQGFVSFWRGRRWCMLWTSMRRIPSR